MERLLAENHISSSALQNGLTFILLFGAIGVHFLNSGVCQTSCPLISCGISDFRGADFGFGVEPDGASRLPVAGFA